MIRSRLKKGDQVRVIAGKDKGKEGKVIRLDRDAGRVLVEGVNLLKKHVAASQTHPEGGVVTEPFPIHVSNVMALDPKSNEPTRIGRQKSEDGQSWVRIAKKSGSVLA